MPLSLKCSDTCDDDKNTGGEPEEIDCLSVHSSFSSILVAEPTTAPSVGQQHALPHQPTVTTPARERVPHPYPGSGTPTRGAEFSTPFRTSTGDAPVPQTRNVLMITPTRNAAKGLMETPTRSPAAFKSSAWATVTPEPAAECPICFEAIHAASAFRSSCGHGYHKQCLSQWRAMHQHQCPLCRAALPRGVGLTPENHASPPPRPPLLPEQAQRAQVATAAQRVRRSMEMRRAMEQQQSQRRQASGPSGAAAIAPPCH